MKVIILMDLFHDLKYQKLYSCPLNICINLYNYSSANVETPTNPILKYRDFGNDICILSLINSYIIYVGIDGHVRIECHMML